MAYLNIPAQEKLRPLDPGQRFGSLLVNPTATSIVAGMIATVVDVGGVGMVDKCDGATATIPAATTSVIGIFGDDYNEAQGLNALQPSGGSKKITVFHGFGRYITLTYVDAIAGSNYTAGDLLYVGTGAEAGMLTRVAPAVGARAVAVCMLPPVKTDAALAWNNTTNPYVAATDVPEFLKGSQFGARPADAMRTFANGDRKPFLGFVWL